MSIVCPSCGRDNPEDARFCSGCATELVAPAPAREERKVVTVLFCDLVGSTARAEGSDPEDVRALLSAYHERVRSELERFGGTVEKFIGDAVMALFGAPTAHEDDPERAVRAALAIREWAQEEGDLQVRIGVTTGEALVALGARPDEGEGMASGDVVNTAARLQSAARVNGILVDESTQRATQRVIEYGGREAVEAKGKAAPVSVWEALEARARVHVEREGRAQLIGRVRELEVLRAALERVREDREPQLVTLVGVPGIGKSRLVYELFKTVETGGVLTFWRHGRSLPYGEGVSFWALGEIVKAQAGVLETDDAAAAESKLRESVAAVVADPADASWVDRHLRPLVGLEAGAEVGSDRRSEAFAAWRRFLEALAEQRPLVVVFEDLHFADDGQLDFVDYLVEWASRVPILVVGTARPELFSRRPEWGGGKANAVTLSLTPLSDADTARLVHELLAQPVLDADLQETLLERAGGNPLYAEEFVRMLEERGQAEELPETVQGLVAARLDALSPDEKGLAQDAAVVGKTFWLGATVSLSGAERWAVEERLHALDRKEFVSRERRSAVAGEIEYVFRHLLVRDVAYGQIPRAARVEKHVKAAQWIESLGRPEDHAEMLAHHYLSALELSRAAGAPTADLGESARVVFREAGDRASALNAYPAASGYYAEALGLSPPDDPERPELLFALARARHRTGDELAEETLEEARTAALAAGQHDRAAEVDALLAEMWWLRGDRARCDVHLNRAAELVKDLPPSPPTAHVLSQLARYRALAGDSEEAVRIGAEALEMAELLGLEELKAHALNNIGLGKCHVGNLEGLADLERSVEIARAARSPEAARALNNLAATAWSFGNLRRAESLIEEGIRIGEQLGATSIARYSRGMQLRLFVDLGRWADAVEPLDTLIADIEAGRAQESGVRIPRAVIRLARGDVDGAKADVERILVAARREGDPQSLYPALGFAALVYAEIGSDEEARLHAHELLEGDRFQQWMLRDVALVADELGYADELRRALHATARTAYSPALQALVDGEFQQAAEAFSRTGEVVYEAAARLRAAEKLGNEGRRAEADEQLQRALAFWRSVGATRYIQQGEALLAETA